MANRSDVCCWGEAQEAYDRFWFQICYPGCSPKISHNPCYRHYLFIASFGFCYGAGSIRYGSPVISPLRCNRTAPRQKEASADTFDLAAGSYSARSVLLVHWRYDPGQDTTAMLVWRSTVQSGLLISTMFGENIPIWLTIPMNHHMTPRGWHLADSYHLFWVCTHSIFVDPIA